MMLSLTIWLAISHAMDRSRVFLQAISSYSHSAALGGFPVLGCPQRGYNDYQPTLGWCKHLVEGHLNLA